ncbi:MAG: BTAD domain-containing putative transcriptional regulator [Chloroflexota bacterium]
MSATHTQPSTMPKSTGPVSPESVSTGPLSTGPLSTGPVPPAKDTAHIQITLLGHMIILIDGQPLSKTPGYMVQALLAYLFCHPGPHERIKLADLLWGDMPRERLLSNLRSLVRRLPAAVKPYIQTTPQMVGIDPSDDIWVDVLALSKLADKLPTPESRLPDTRSTETKYTDLYMTQLQACEDSVKAMLAYYTDDFLAGLVLGDAPRFADWQYMQREALRQLVMDALRNVVELCLYQGRYSDGIAYTRRWIALDPLEEVARRQLMVMLARSGQQKAALQTYQAMVEMLEEEFAAPPMPETVEAYERILNRDTDDNPNSADTYTHQSNKMASTVLNLPTFAQPSVGRRSDLGTLTHQLQKPDCCLLTITGLGGAGKTYLAVEVAKMAAQSQHFAQGVVFISLASVPAADRLPEAIVQALALILADSRNVLAQIGSYLEPKEMLITLDNFEHLLAPPQSSGHSSGQSSGQPSAQSAVQMLSHLLHVAPHVKFLVTSRQPLRLQHEYLYALSGMVLPELHTPISLSDLMHIDAILLFQQAAQRTNFDFAVTAENQQAVIRFCHLVQGTPLAIVLGAAHMDFLEPEELVEECQESMDVLESTWADLPDRQRSVRAVFDYSWRLLDPALQQVFQQLSVFRGGFTRQAARQVVGVSLSQLKHLHTHSLIKLTDKGRYEIHELLRQFGAEKLAFSDEQTPNRQATSNSGASVWDKHMHHYLTWLGEQSGPLQGRKPQEAVKAIEVDLQNIRQAWVQAITTQDIRLLTKSHQALFIFYEMKGFYQEGIDRAKHALQTVQPRIKQLAIDHTHSDTAFVELYCLLLAKQNFFYVKLGGYEQVEQTVEAVMSYIQTLPESSDIRYTIQAHIYWVWANALNRQNSYSLAYDKLIQALEWAKQADDLMLVADCFYLRGLIHFFLDEFTEAVDDAQQARQLYIQTQNRWKEIPTLTLLGSIQEWLGKLSLAKGYYEEVIQISHDLGDDLNKHQLNLARVAIYMGDYSYAEPMIQQSLRFFSHMNHKTKVANAHYHLSMLYNKLGLYHKAKYHQEKSLETKRTSEADAEAYLQLNLIYIGLGDYETALDFVTKAQQIADDLALDYLQAEVEMYMAYTFGLLGHIDKSIHSYKQALDFYRHSERGYTKIEIMAGLANALRLTGDLVNSLEYIEEVLLYVTKNVERIYVFLRPIELYLNCYYILHACQDPRASLILDTGYALLQTFANRITNKVWQTSFLENVRTHQMLRNHWFNQTENTDYQPTINDNSNDVKI